MAALAYCVVVVVVVVAVVVVGGGVCVGERDLLVHEENFRTVTQAGVALVSSGDLHTTFNKDPVHATKTGVFALDLASDVVRKVSKNWNIFNMLERIKISTIDTRVTTCVGSDGDNDFAQSVIQWHQN